jgi:hypothetical protein
MYRTHLTPSGVERGLSARTAHLLGSKPPATPEITSRPERLRRPPRFGIGSSARRHACRESEEPPGERRSDRRSTTSRAPRPSHPPFGCATSRDARRCCLGTTTRPRAGSTPGPRSSPGPPVVTAPDRSPPVRTGDTVNDTPSEPEAERPASETPAAQAGRPTRMPCPVCGSTRTQPFGHAGPAARVNMRCLRCGHQFRDKTLRR